MLRRWGEDGDLKRERREKNLAEKASARRWVRGRRDEDVYSVWRKVINPSLRDLSLVGLPSHESHSVMATV